jgi:hypothetical protein
MGDAFPVRKVVTVPITTPITTGNNTSAARLGVAETEQKTARKILEIVSI